MRLLFNSILSRGIRVLDNLVLGFFSILFAVAVFLLKLLRPGQNA